MLPAPNRRWLRFSLRTMLVAFTVVALWLGWNVHVVRQRREFLSSFRATGANYWPLQPPFPDATEMEAKAVEIPPVAAETFGPEPYTQYPPLSPGPLSKVRVWLDDQPCIYFMYWAGRGLDTDHIRRLFPEAIVVISDRPYEEAAAEHGWRMPSRRLRP